MLKRLFGIGIYGNLYNLWSQSSKSGYSCRNQIYCGVSARPKNKYGFTASVTTNNPYRGDLDGVFVFYYSKSYKTFMEASLALTEQVAYANGKIPGAIYYRVSNVGSEKDAKTYLDNYQTLPDREEWLENAIKRGRKGYYPIQEQFENGAWTIHVTQGVEHLNLLEDSIEIGTGDIS